MRFAKESAPRAPKQERLAGWYRLAAPRNDIELALLDVGRCNSIYRCTAKITPLCIDNPLYVPVNALSPLGTEDGTTTLSCTSPGETNPANVTVAVIPPTFTIGNWGNVPDCVTAPLSIGTDVGPSPLAYSVTVSFGAAGVLKPGYNVVEPNRLPFAWIAVACRPSKTKNDGEYVCAATIIELAADP
jgi:hypothetical protein